MTAVEKAIRQVEREALDVHHILQPALDFHEDDLIHLLLKCYGEAHRSQELQGQFAEANIVGSSHFWHLFRQAVNHCIRWTADAKGTSDRDPTQSDCQDDAYELLVWGLDYSKLVADHIAWGGGFIRATVNPEDRKIDFGKLDLDLRFMTDQIAADHREQLAWSRSYPMESFVACFNAWQRHANWTDNGLEFDASFIRQNCDMQNHRHWVDTRTFAMIDNGRRLGSYTLGEFRHFLTFLHLTTNCISQLEDEIDKRFGDVNAMGSWVLRLNRDGMIDWWSQCTGLAPPLVSEIVADLTFDRSRFNSHLSATPFILSSTGEMMLAPRMVALTDFGRMVTSSLTFGRGRSAYDSISGDVESWHLNHLARLLREAGLNVLVNPSIGPHATPLTPDLLVYDEQNLACIEFKNSLVAMNPHSVVNRLREYEKGIGQVRKYLAILRLGTGQIDKIPSHLRPSATGLLLFREPLALPVTPSDEIGILNLHELTSSIHHLQPKRIAVQDLAGIAFRWRHLTAFPAQIRMETRVGEWTYSRYAAVVS